jgi:hypothetical protein
LLPGTEAEAEVGAGAEAVITNVRLRLLSFYHRLDEILQKKIMVAEELFVNC